MTPPVLVSPDLKSLVNMAASRLNTITEAISMDDKPLSPKIAKHARETKALVLLIIQEINNVREAQKAAPTKKGQ